VRSTIGNACTVSDYIRKNYCTVKTTKLVFFCCAGLTPPRRNRANDMRCPYIFHVFFTFSFRSAMTRTDYLGEQVLVTAGPRLRHSIGLSKCRAAKILNRKFEKYIHRKGTVWLQSQFLHSCFCVRFIYSRIGLHILLQENRGTDCGNI